MFAFTLLLMKVLLAYIFLFIFSFQVLPVKELGKILCKGQMTEEVHESGECGDDGPCAKVKKGTELFKLSETEYTAVDYYLHTSVLTAIHYAEDMNTQHIPDIFAPPPNC